MHLLRDILHSTRHFVALMISRHNLKSFRKLLS